MIPVAMERLTSFSFFIFIFGHVLGDEFVYDKFPDTFRWGVATNVQQTGL